MKTNFNKMQELNKAILEDAQLKILLEQKNKILNMSNPKYLVNKDTNTTTAILDEKVVELLDKIDLLIEHRTHKIKMHYVINQ